jgi:hypothetical protein
MSDLILKIENKINRQNEIPNLISKIDYILLNKHQILTDNDIQALENEKLKLKAWFAFTVTPFNVFHFPEFMKWKLIESGLTKFNPINDMRPIVSHHMCHSPKYYNVKVLPPELKQAVVEHYREYIEWINNTDFSDHVKKDFAKVLNGVIKFMNSEDYSAEWLGTFVKTTVKLDEIRNQSIIDIVPQYKELFDAYNK